jgi:acyl carrier protein
MDKPQIFNELIEVIREAVGDYDTEIDRETVAMLVDGWDSVTHINVILSIESHFSIRFPEDKIYSLANVGELLDLTISLIPENNNA